MPVLWILNIPLITGRVIIKIINMMMIVRRISNINWSSFSLRIDSRSSNLKNLIVLKFIVRRFLRFNKCIIKGIAASGTSHKKIGVNKLIKTRLVLIQGQSKQAQINYH